MATLSDADVNVLANVDAQIIEEATEGFSEAIDVVGDRIFDELHQEVTQSSFSRNR